MTYKYKIENDCFVVKDMENNNETILSNFTAKIVKKVKYVFDDGSDLLYYYIEGMMQNGDMLKPINKLTEEDFNKGDWLHTQWGSKAELENLDNQKLRQC